MCKTKSIIQIMHNVNNLHNLLRGGLEYAKEIFQNNIYDSGDGDGYIRAAYERFGTRESSRA